MGDENALKQDLTEQAHYSGVYMIWLLFQEKAENPSLSALTDKLSQKFGKVDVVSGEGGLRSFALTEHLVTYKNGGQAPSQVMLSECSEIKKPFGDAIARTQFWNCPNGVELMDSCSWQVMVSDFLAGGLDALERADVLSDWLEICLELFPACTVVYFGPSCKLLTAQNARENPYTGPLRFMHGGVNARFFNIQGSDNMLVDTLGMYALGLPDMQYYFHGVDPNIVVRHAYNTAIYQFQNGAPIQPGDTIDGDIPGSKWSCQYEKSLIQPARNVLNVDMGERAAGNRN